MGQQDSQNKLLVFLSYANEDNRQTRKTQQDRVAGTQGLFDLQVPTLAGRFAQRRAKGEDINGGQFTTTLNAWRQLPDIKKNGNLRQQLESTGNFSRNDLDS